MVRSIFGLCQPGEDSTGNSCLLTLFDWFARLDRLLACVAQLAPIDHLVLPHLLYGFVGKLRK